MWILSLTLLIKSIISIIKKEEQDITIIKVKEEYKSWLMIICIILFWIMLHWISFLISALIFCTLAMMIFRCKKWYYYVSAYTIVVVVTYVFQHFLNLNAFRIFFGRTVRRVNKRSDQCHTQYKQNTFYTFHDTKN